MTFFAEKEVFNLLGLETIKQSPLHTSQDCTICTEPLDMQPSPTQEGKLQSKHHTAVRIIACGHVVGEKCLDIWLDTSHRCPICRRELFEAKGGVMTAQDIESVVRKLSRYFGKGRVMASVARVTTRVGGKYMARKQVRGEGMQYAQVERDGYGGDGGGEGWSSDGEMEFDDDEEEDEDDDMELYEDEDEELVGEGQDKDEDEELEDCEDAKGQEGDKKNLPGSAD